MRDKPNIRDILENACKEFGLTMSEALAIMKTPLHPRELRDEFAGKALRIAWNAYNGGYTGQPELVEQSIAHHAYQIADAMLKAREA
jgi:hypothetical protein